MPGLYRLSCQHAQNAGVAAVCPVILGIPGWSALTRPWTDTLPWATFTAGRKPRLHRAGTILPADQGGNVRRARHMLVRAAGVGGHRNLPAAVIRAPGDARPRHGT